MTWQRQRQAQSEMLPLFWPVLDAALSLLLLTLWRFRTQRDPR